MQQNPVDDSLQFDGVDKTRHNIKEQRKEKGILKKPRGPLQQRGFVSFCQFRTIYLASERDGLATPLTRGLVEQDHRVLDAEREAPSGCQYSEVVRATHKAVTGYVR
jgi:hypothetical protein